MKTAKLEGQALTELAGIDETREINRITNSASALSTAVTQFVDATGLAMNIQGKRHVMAEGWQFILEQRHEFPVEDSVERQTDGSYIATVNIMAQTGEIVGRGSALCGRDEPRWKNAPEYAIRSMAITRAIGKACRMKYGWIMRMAGYEATPLEEMTDANIKEEKVTQQKPSSKPVQAKGAETTSDPVWHSEELEGVVVIRDDTKEEFEVDSKPDVRFHFSPKYAPEYKLFKLGETIRFEGYHKVGGSGFAPGKRYARKVKVWAMAKKPDSDPEAEKFLETVDKVFGGKQANKPIES